jgi:two-component system, NarL family, response regulator NreC
MDIARRILIVDDHPALREGLRSVLYIHPNFNIVGEAADGMEALNSVEKLRPDLILMDLSMPRMDGVTATREIKKKWPKTKILAFTNHNAPEYLTAVLKAGADGYLSKDSSRTELIQCIEDILDGKRRVQQNIME